MKSLPWMDTAISLLGTKEVPGAGNNPKIIRWAELLGGWTAEFYDKDSIPWCGLFVGHCMAHNGIAPPNELLRALAWAGFGEKIDKPALGAVLVFKRQGGGHVGFYVSEDKDTYHVLGGNQEDMVNIARVEKKRLVAMRWPKELKRLYVPKPIVKKFDGKISRNEE